VARPDESRYCDDEQSTQQVGVDKHLAATPLVEEDAGEGSDEGVGKEENGESSGDGSGRGLALRREEHEGRESCLEQAVAELPREADPEESLEVADDKDGAQIAQGRHE
jgi:hypothetical protein